MAIERWNPLGDMMTLRDAMDRLLQESFVWPTGAPSGRRSGMPLDVEENDNSYVVYASLPGIRPEDVQITIQGDTLTIRGETRDDQEQPKSPQEQGQPQRNYIMRERRYSSYYRAITLPGMVDADKADAHFEHGELRLTLPKAEQAKPKQIKINGGTQPRQLGQQGEEPQRA